MEELTSFVIRTVQITQMHCTLISHVEPGYMETLEILVRGWCSEGKDSFLRCLSLLCMYLAEPGFSCRMQDPFQLQQVSFGGAHEVLVVACGV